MSTSTPQPPPPPPTATTTHHHSSRSLRRNHATLLRLSTTLKEEQALLHRLWYKSRAQFRNAKWLSPCDVVRRRLKVVDGLVGEALRSSAGLYDAMTVAVKDGGQGSSSSSASQQALPKRPPAPPGSLPLPPPALITTHLLTLLSLSCALDELSTRARVAFSLLEAHLRTPPAPTFAPLVTTLLGLCAGVHARCGEGIEVVRHAYDEVAGAEGMGVGAKGRGVMVGAQAARVVVEGRSSSRRRMGDEEALRCLPRSLVARRQAKGRRKKEGHDGGISCGLETAEALPVVPAPGSRPSLVDEMLKDGAKKLAR